MDDSLTFVPEARADAFGDLLLRNVHVTAKVTLGVPVVTGAPGPEPAANGETTRVRYDRGDDDTVVDHDTGELVRLGDLTPASREELSWVEMSPETAGDLATVVHPVSDGCAVSGTRLAGLGWVEPHTVAGLLKTLPLDVARAVLDAHTGTLASHTANAYRPPAAMRELVTTRDGTCRMWGCTRPADHTDLDHTRPWPDGPTTPANLAGLCRRHHRMKQTGRWRYTIDPRRHHHLDLHHRPHPHHPTPAPRRRRGRSAGWVEAELGAVRVEEDDSVERTLRGAARPGPQPEKPRPFLGQGAAGLDREVEVNPASAGP